MAFQNTVEVVGDVALTNSLIDRTITEFNDNIVEVVDTSAFYGCTALTKVNLLNVTEIGYQSFSGCSSLEMADFSNLISVGQASFSSCSALKALIIRNTDTVATLKYSLGGSCGIGSVGYIYVPSVLVESYKVAEYWSNYADYIRAIEDYPEICNLYTWSTVAKTISEGTYKDYYSIGDCVELDLGDEGIINMEIVAFDTDELADGSGTAAITWIAKELLATSKRMNPSVVSTTDDNGATVYTEGTGAIGGWTKTEMYTYLNETIKPLIAENIRSNIKTVNKYTRIYNTSGTVENNVVSTDDIWIPSTREIFNNTNYETEGVVYSSKFTDSTSRIKKKVGSTSASSWWLRSAYSTSGFRSVNSSGSSSGSSAGSTSGVALGFCM